MVDPTERISAVPAATPVRFELDTGASVDDTASSIAPAEGGQAYSPSKPPLESPLWKVLENNQRHERAIDRWQSQRGDGIDEKVKKMEELQVKEAAALREAKEIEQDISFWGMLEDVGNSMMGVLTFGLGTSALAAGSTAVGGALLVSGTCSVGNLAFKHLGIWDSIATYFGGQDAALTESIKAYAPAAVGVAAASLGVVGSFAGWQYTTQSGIAGLTSLIQGTGTLATTMALYSKGMSTSAVKHLQADLTGLQTGLKLCQQTISNYVNEWLKFHEREMHTSEALARLIESTNQTIQQTQQPV